MRRPHLLPCLCTIALGVSFGWLSPLAGSAADAATAPDRLLANEAASTARASRPPRKVLVGTGIVGYQVFSETLDRRLDRMDRMVDSIASEGARAYPGRPLDLIVLTEYFLANPGTTAEVQTINLDQVQPRVAACAKRHGSYLIVPMLLREAGPPIHYSNAAVLFDRQGNLVGMYRKVHPVAAVGSRLLEGGLTPGSDFPVFNCDFGKLGIQICFDMLYEDGWKALAKEGAQIVALPSASAETTRPMAYAREHQYYIVSAAPRDHAAVISPLGSIEYEATAEGQVLVREIDLSYDILHWEDKLDEGEALQRRYGSRVGYLYYKPEDRGIFWSNDPSTPIGTMVTDSGFVDEATKIVQVRKLEDEVRGGPPLVP